MAIFPCAGQYILVAYLFYTQQFVSLNSYSYHVPPSAFSPLVTTSLFSISVILSLFFFCICLIFQIPQISDKMEYLFFSVQHIALSIILSRSIYIVANGGISFFLWLSNISLYMCVSMSICICVCICICVPLYPFIC